MHKLSTLVFLFLFLVLAPLACGQTTSSPENIADTLVVIPDSFRKALEPWVEYRTKQGRTILLVKPSEPKSLKQEIKRIASLGKLRTVVLIGDSKPTEPGSKDYVPTDFIAAKVNVLFGADAEIATDNSYVDVDDDGSPDLAIGRIPVDSSQELSRFINRIIEYESESNVGHWQRRMNFVAGVGGFGKTIDTVIEQTTKQIITQLIPFDYTTTITYGSWTSPYCPDPRRFSEESIKRFNEGCLFWVYIGHGARHQLDRVYFPDRSRNILDLGNVHTLDCKQGSPIAIFLACYTGATDHPRDCLAEEMLRQDRGPIAVICGSRVTMPYAMSLFSLEMVNEYFYGELDSMGELFLASKQKMLSKLNADDKIADFRKMINGMGIALSPKPSLLEKERLEHVHLLHYLGDPLLKIRRPELVPLQVEPIATAGKSIVVKGNSPANGSMTVDVIYRRDRFRKRPKRRKTFEATEASFQEFQSTYEQTQQLVCATKSIQVAKGEFETEIKLPDNCNGECYVRAIVTGSNRIAMGVAPIKIKTPAKN